MYRKKLNHKEMKALVLKVVANNTVRFLRSMGFEVCTTRPYSPENNGMAEGEWFEEYNNHAPHKALGMMSPRDYRFKLAG